MKNKKKINGASTVIDTKSNKLSKTAVSINDSITSSSTCNSIPGPTGATGPDGNQGLSAYDVAVNNGFIGSQAEWLSSLIGAEGDQIIQNPIIPFSNATANFGYQKADSFSLKTTRTMDFGMVLDMIFSEIFPSVISSNITNKIPAFTVTYDMTIQKIVASFAGLVYNTDTDSEVLVGLYCSQKNSNTYEFLPQTAFSLGSIIGDGNHEDITLDSEHDNINVNIPAGSKLAFIAFAKSLNADGTGIITVQGRLFGSMILK